MKEEELLVSLAIGFLFWWIFIKPVISKEIRQEQELFEEAEKEGVDLGSYQATINTFLLFVLGFGSLLAILLFVGIAVQL